MLSTTTPHRHSPPWTSGDDQPVFLIRAGSVIERAQVEAELSGQYGAGRVFAWSMLEVFIEGVNKLLAEDPGREELVALARRQADPDDDGLTADEEQVVEEARRVLAEHWPPYRALRQQMALRREIAPIVALRRFLVGMENVAVPFHVGPDGRVAEATLSALDPLQMLDAGHAAYNLLYPDEARLTGNSAAPSQPDDGQPISASGGSSKADGKSAGSTGPKTRSRRSPPKSSP